MVERVDLDFAAAMDHVRAARGAISRADAARAFADGYGVDVFFATARFVDRQTIMADDAPLRFRRALIATGSRPKEPDVPGLAKADYLTNETVFNLTRRPDRLAVLGGGPLGCEMAQAFARLGSRVTLIEHSDRLLGREAPAAAVLIRGALARDGVTVRTGTTVTRAGRAGDETTLRLKPGDASDALAVDALLVGVGRTPDLDGLGLDAARVAYDRHGVTVDDYLCTTNRRIFAAGDMCLREQFTHTADASARLAVQNALLIRSKRWSRQTVPHMTYTEPELAQVGPVGLADARGVRAYEVPLSQLDRAVVDAETDGFVRVLVYRRSGRIRGATIIGPGRANCLRRCWR